MGLSSARRLGRLMQPVEIAAKAANLDVESLARPAAIPPKGGYWPLAG